MSESDKSNLSMHGIAYSIPVSVKKGTFALNIRTLYEEFNRNYPGHGGVMTMRSLDEFGIARKDPRTISDSEPFYVTGNAFVSNSGKIVLVEIIPTDGMPSWIELKNTSLFEAESIASAGEHAAARWFTIDYDRERVKFNPQSEEEEEALKILIKSPDLY